MPPPALLVLLWFTALWHGPASARSISDLPVYARDAAALAAGHSPYGALHFEYPPLALIPIRLARIAGVRHYELVFGILMLVMAIALMLAVTMLARERRAPAAWTIALTPLLTGALIRTHFDLVPVVLLVMALVAITRQRPALGGALLGAGAMAKGFPLVILPLVVAWFLGRGQTRAAIHAAVACLAVIAAVSVPFASSGYIDAYHFHLQRPIQVESTPASILLVAGGSYVTGVTTGYADRFRSNGVRGGAAPWVLGATTALLVAALLLLTLAAYGRQDEMALLLCAAGVTVALTGFGKVGSPQFAVWLLPWMALAFAWREWALGATLAAAVLLTQVEFPRHYFDLVAGQPAAIALVTTRNAMLLLALALIARRLAPGAIRARSSLLASATTP